MTSILVIGPVRFIKDKLDGFSARGYDWAHITPDTRQDLLDDLDGLKDRQFSAVMILAPNLTWGKFDEAVFSRLNLDSLKLVTGIGAGFDHVDVEYLTKHGSYYANTPLAVADPTATTAVMLILQTIRDATHASATLRAGQFSKGLGFTPDPRGLVVGIVGMGTIGKLVRDKVTALGMKVIYYNRQRLPADEENGARFVSFDELLKESRLISLHCPLTPETRHLLSDTEFAKMQDGAFVVNTARGPVIDEEALVRAMQSGKVLRCGLDVFEKEPEVHPWLISSDRATILPHYSAYVEGIFQTVEEEVFGNVLAWAENGVPNTPVNRPV
ncbi:hypothetical protein M408DRAFT_272215 [Serendipita vermifera MAFF 305830]|uniref:D-isomer specific 2-hydroxyacid dehydrogenase NAD-binding domain-containing protein n=1 Tax=Serendipita vermifera MAFF 305830 TaxID=933852 RepID=A0A0C2XPJ6_SERVB|nr:hypothetical protein M408DRAFT_272215 [Serendipita vermifera MAFF 305830]